MPCRAYVAPCRRPCRATAEKTTTMHGSHNKVQDTRPGLQVCNSHAVYIYIYTHIVYTHVHMHTFIYEYMMDLVAPALSQKPAFVTYFVARGAPRPCYIPEGFDSLPYIYIHIDMYIYIHTYTHPHLCTQHCDCHCGCPLPCNPS